jgi:hypothetical protein
MLTAANLDGRGFSDGLVHQQPAPRRRNIFHVGVLLMRHSILHPGNPHDIGAKEAVLGSSIDHALLHLTWENRSPGKVERMQNASGL